MMIYTDVFPCTGYPDIYNICMCPAKVRPMGVHTDCLTITVVITDSNIWWVFIRNGSMVMKILQSLAQPWFIAFTTNMSICRRFSGYCLTGAIRNDWPRSSNCMYAIGDKMLSFLVFICLCGTLWPQSLEVWTKPRLIFRFHSEK